MQSRITFYSMRNKRVQTSTQTVANKQEHGARIYRFKNGRNPYLGAILLTERQCKLPEREASDGSNHGVHHTWQA